MVATIEIDGARGGSANAPASFDHAVANFRFQNEDTNDQDTAAPVDIPSGADVFAFWKHIYIHCTVAPDTQINNVEVFGDGALGFTGVTAEVNDQVCQNSSTATAGYDPGQAAVLTTHDTITTTTDFFATFTSGAPKSLAISEVGSVINAAGEFSDYLVMQMDVSNTAVQGVQAPAETVTWQWDEI